MPASSEKDKRELIDYGSIKLLNIEAEAPGEWNTHGATHMRVTLPADRSNQAFMAASGFSFGDRLLGVKILPGRTKIDYARMVRVEPELVAGPNQEILDIALASFSTDRRFHVSPDYDRSLAEQIIKAWVADLGEVMLCRLKGQTAGFLALKDLGDKRSFIHLAAVSEKYRSAGIALSLYAAAVQRSAELGFAGVEGRISSTNLAVMNVYSFLGAVFFETLDVYLKVI